ncbi:MAG: phosphoenolpyruvate--protein phosphotransferase [Planctomycetes bacterium]|nr:phosphoenolpyruvate--protein phosphotransferase [Planctomycetota bacterium]
MHIKKGIPVSPGIVIGEAYILENEEYLVRKKEIPESETQNEIDRFEKACSASVTELQSLVTDVNKKIGQGYSHILDAYIKIIDDPSTKSQIKKVIASDHFSAEYAVETVLKRYIKALMVLNDQYFSARVQDIQDIKKRILRNLFGAKKQDLTKLKKSIIIVAQDLSPSQTVSLDREKIIGFITDTGGRTSHTAIVARAMGIPAVVGLETVSVDISGGDILVVDGNNGLVIINPDEETLKKYRQMEKIFTNFEKNLTIELKDQPSVTLDGHKVRILANIEFPEEVASSLKFGAEGIGLYRTEFLYINTRTHPTEEEHFKAYKKAIDELGNKEIIIRTLDMGADKFETSEQAKEHNPFLGCRAIRLCMLRTELFKPQLKAILRIAFYGKNVKMMLPMIATVEEIRQVKAILEQVKSELRRSNVQFSDNLQTGIMIETPSAAITADLLADEVDFFSIGTNDLIQYTIAVDRINEKVAYLYQPAHPAILRLLQNVIAAGKKHNKRVAMCGEMSGDPLYTILLLGMGLMEFSVTPTSIPTLKKIIRSVTMDEAKKTCEKALTLKTSEEIRNFLTTRIKRIIPEAF